MENDELLDTKELNTLGCLIFGVLGFGTWLGLLSIAAGVWLLLR